MATMHFLLIIDNTINKNKPVFVNALTLEHLVVAKGYSCLSKPFSLSTYHLLIPPDIKRLTA